MAFLAGSDSIAPAGNFQWVNRENRWYSQMRFRWNMIRDLKGGTVAMRRAAKTYLPKEEAESEKAYKNRLNRSFLYPAYHDTVRKIVSKPFSKPVVVRGTDVTEELARISYDTDRSGKDLTSFAAEVMEAAIDFGYTHILVDYPTVPDNATLEFKKSNGIRPTFIHVTPRDLIGFSLDGPSATGTLSEVRIREIKTEVNPDDNVERDVVYIRHIKKGEWVLYKNDGYKDGFREISRGPNTLGKIPMVTVYFNRTGHLQAEPALEGLAWLNVAHWQSESDQRNILSFSRFGLLFGCGFAQEKIDAGIEVGPRRLIATENPDAKLQVVETSGQAIACGERDLRSLEQRMEVLGLQPFVQRSGVETATGKKLHEGKTISTVLSWVYKTENALRTAYELAAEWENQTLPNDFEIDIFDEFTLDSVITEDARVLLDACNSGRLSVETFLDELQRRGLLAESVHVKDELDKISTQAPDMDLPDPVKKGQGNGNDKPDDSQ